MTNLNKAGVITTDISPYGDVASTAFIQADGKILVAGYSNNGSDHDIALARYNSNGTLDQSFSEDGKVTTAIGSSTNDSAYSVIPLPR